MYIIIRGPLGVGKTTMAKKLAERINAQYISVDEILDEHGLDETEGECIPVKNFLKANEIALKGIGDKAVIDGNFYHKEQLDDLVNKLPDCKVYTLKAPVHVCVQRDKERTKPYGEDAAKAVHCMVSRFDYGTIIETEGKTVDQCVEEILRKL